MSAYDENCNLIKFNKSRTETIVLHVSLLKEEHNIARGKPIELNFQASRTSKLHKRAFQTRLNPESPLSLSAI